MLAWEGAPCIPTYHADGCPPISEAQVVEPTQGCRVSTAHLLPSCPALAVDQRQATRPGTAVMMAIAVPSLSCPNPRVQFWLILFPADKIQRSNFYSPPPRHRSVLKVRDGQCVLSIILLSFCSYHAVISLHSCHLSEVLIINKGMTGKKTLATFAHNRI